MAMMSPCDFSSSMDEDSLQELYTWIDEIPLSRPKKNITRDFSDGVLVAEIVHNFLPKQVELHNYIPANSQNQKLVNWSTLNRKVFAKIGYTVPESVIKQVVTSKPGLIEIVLHNLRLKIDRYIARKKAQALRDQQQVYDEFSPDGPVTDHSAYMYPEGHMYTGPENNFGYPYNTAPPQDGRFVLQAQQAGHPVDGLGPVHSYPSAGPAHQQPSVQGSGSSAASNSPRGAGSLKRGKIEHRGGLNYAGVAGKPRQKGPVTRSQGPPPEMNGEMPNLRLVVEEKEQSLLASQETIQILQAKVRRLEHLLHLKDIRIEDLTKRLQQITQPPPRHLPPQQNAPAPPLSQADKLHSIQNMYQQQPLPPLQHPQYHSQMEQ